jgi:hypothetical protein
MASNEINHEPKYIIENLLKLCNQLNQNEFEKQIERSYEYFLEEIEIKIESINIELNAVNSLLKKKLRSFKRKIIKLNNFKFLDENSLKSSNLLELEKHVFKSMEIMQKLNHCLNDSNFEIDNKCIEMNLIGNVPIRVYDIPKDLIEWLDISTIGTPKHNIIFQTNYFIYNSRPN